MATAKKEQVKKEPKNELIKMKRDDGKTADVHPDSVLEYQAAGFKEYK